MARDFSGELKAHMTHEEAFQASVHEAMRETAVALGNVATRMEQSEKIHERMADSMDKIDGRVDGHETRLNELERSVRQAAGIAKFFFGGGLLAFLATAFAVLKLIEPMRVFLESLHK